MVPIHEFMLFMCVIDIFIIIAIMVTDPYKPKYKPKFHEVHFF